MADTIRLMFERERETKNTVRFQEQSEEPIIGTLYVQKRVARDAQQVAVTLQFSTAKKGGE